MTDPVKPTISKSFKDVCLVEDKPDGKGIQVTAYGKDGKPFATGDAFRKEGVIWDTFLDNMKDLVSVGGKATGDSHTLGNGKYGATYQDGGIKLNVPDGKCEVTTVDGGQNPNRTVTLGVQLKAPAFDVTR